MTLNQIRYFLTLAECLSFTQAARKLYLSQPTLSKQIAALEKELGYALFVRNQHSVQLTSQGSLLQKNLKLPMQCIDSALEEAEKLSRGKQQLKVGILTGQIVPDDFSNKLLNLVDRFEKLDVIVERQSFSALREGLLTGIYDLILTLQFDVDDEPEIEYQPIHEGSGVVAVMHRDHPTVRKDVWSIQDFRDEYFVVISPEESPNAYKFVDYLCKDSGFTPKIRKLALSLEELALSVELGLGIAIMDANSQLTQMQSLHVKYLDNAPRNLLVAAHKKGVRNPWLANLGLFRETQHQ